jgi:hypothetical protein
MSETKGSEICADVIAVRSEAERLLALPLRAWPERPVRVNPLPAAALRGVRVLVLLSVALLGYFFWWLFDPQHRGEAWLFWPLMLAWGLRAASLALEWTNYCALKVEPERPITQSLRVDMLTTACPGEPREMIVRTLLAMVRVRLPHENFLCDEGDDPILREVCRRLGVHHVTRTVKRDAKAGNINNALRTRCTGDIAVVLDPDHEPAPYLLERTLGYFDDPRVGFVQSVQPYGNQEESGVARGAAEQTYLFYGPMMLGMHGLGTTQAIGANCIFRRAALDSIGGHAAGLAEDMHTSMRLYAAGWTSVYVPEMLTRGLVPSTLGAFFKQQIKWSCGSFDLLYQVYPRLFTRFTWAQRWHYLLAPLSFLKGLIVLIEVLIPILALVTEAVPLRVEFWQFCAYFLPLVAMSYLLRQLVQRWVLEPHEQGLHWLGGVLATGTWWPYLSGFLCACFRVKVPYIPTPKDNELVDEWRVAMPNLVFACLSFAAAAWGLWRDDTIYTWMMAGFAIFNGAQLLHVVAMGQRLTLSRLRAWSPLAWLIGRAACLGEGFHRARGRFLGRLRERTFRHAFLACALTLNVFLLLAHRQTQPVPHTDLTRVVTLKEVGGFHWGVWDEELPKGANLEPRRIFWGLAPKLGPARAGVRPFWQVGPPPGGDWAAVVAGREDAWLRELAEALREDGRPGFIAFAPGPDGGAAADYVIAWQRIYGLFEEEAASHLAWAWDADRGDPEAWYPGGFFVDWVLASFPVGEELPTAYRERRTYLAGLHKPVMLELRVSSEEGVSGSVLRRLRAFNEISGLLGGGPGQGEVRQGWARLVGQISPLPPATPARTPRSVPSTPGLTLRLAGRQGEWRLLAGDKAIEVRGVAYNTGHDWRDNGVVLTRRQIETDLDGMLEMGANTVRRYGLGEFDRNLLRALEERPGMHLLHGFYFDPEVDYLKDEAKMREYEEEVLRTVEERRGHPSLLAWGLGNETWGLLKHHYARPYLVEVRRAHAHWVGELARKVRALDPEHPVFVTHEASEELPATLRDFVDLAPDLDFTAVNVFAERAFVALPEQFHANDPLRPYLISEFGPEGYWVGGPHVDRHGIESEDDAETKATLYARRYREYIQPRLGQVLGGVAYCWRDRLEGTATWFGMHDDDGRPKPSFYALRELWAGVPAPELPRIRQLHRPQEVVEPGGSVVCTVDFVAPKGVSPKIRWRLLDQNFRPAGRVSPSADGRSVTVTMPEGPSDLYRLHVALETAGWAVDASTRLIAWAPPPAAAPVLAAAEPALAE